MPLSTGQLLNNRYRIDALIGQGGMGAVYDAWDTNLNIRCAIKENQLITEAARRQFEREARLLATLRHSNLPNVIDHFFIPGQGQYLVMSFIEGEDLAQRLKRLGPLPEAEVIRWADEVLSALAYLHKRGIIHRDIKPNNIKLTPEGEAVLVDFGLAKESDAGGMTLTGARGLTPGFAPPEQYPMQGGGTDIRSDIYALGATLYVLLTGEAPADAFSRLTRPESFVPLARRAGRARRPVAEAIDRALAMEPDKRFQSAEAMRAGLPTRPLGRAPEATPAGARPATPKAAAAKTLLADSVKAEKLKGFRWWWLGAASLVTGGIALAGILALGNFGPQLAALAAPSATPTPTASLTPTATPTTAPSATPVPTPTATPLPIGGGTGWLAFNSNRDGNLEIYLVNLDSLETLNLTNNPAEDKMPAWSRDGQRLAFVSNRDGDDEIFVMNADGSDLIQVTENSVSDHFPAWSPDGSRLAFNSKRDGNNEIYVIPAPGTNPTGAEIVRVTNHSGDDFIPTWSSDSTRVVFTSNRDGNFEIYVARADGSRLMRLTTHPGRDSYQAWSPDGKYIAFESNRDGELEIYVMNFDGSDAKQLTNNAVEDVLPAWSPDGKYIAFGSYRDGNAEIYFMGSDGSNPTRLTDDAQGDGKPVWQP